MIPLRDENPSRTVPVVTRLILAANLAAFLYELALGQGLGPFLSDWGLVPLRATRALGGEGAPLLALASALTSTFLHAGWLHLVGNLWYLWIFGDNVEDRLGHAGYLLFYLAAGAASGALHVLVNPLSPVPTIGASGAIAGVLGAYLVMFPRARVITLVPLFVFFKVMALPAVLVLGLWFVFQFFSGALALAYATGTSGGVAWWGHIGGFAFGALVGLASGRRRGPGSVDR